MKLLPALMVLACCVGSGCAPLPVARCNVDRPSVGDKVTLLPVYPNKHFQLFHVVGDVFVDIKYSSFTSSVQVNVVQVPHYPWSFGENVIGRHALRMSDRNGLKIGELALDAVEPGSKLVCREEGK